MTDLRGLPKMHAAGGRATCSAGHAWRAIRISGWRWSTQGEGSRRRLAAGDHVRFPVEDVTYSPADCPSCGQQPTGFREEQRR